MSEAEKIVPEAVPDTVISSHQRFSLECEGKQSERIRAHTERIDALMEIVKYFNSEKEGKKQTSVESYSKSTIEIKGRILESHEDDILTLAMLEIKTLLGFTRARINEASEPTTKEVGS